MSKVIRLIDYAGLKLPVMKNERGEDCTPLKPIADLFGLSWRDQRKKLVESPFLMRHLGLTFVEKAPKPADSGEDILTSNGGEGPKTADSGMGIHASKPGNRTYLPEVLIRIDRVAAYLMTINPEKVRAAGNERGSDFLEARLTEWADALHDFIEDGVAVNLNHVRADDARRKQREAFARMMVTKTKMEDPADRRAVGQVAAQMAAELGVMFQLDLPEGGAK